jgi:hypothetical protein
MLFRLLSHGVLYHAAAAPRAFVASGSRTRALASIAGSKPWSGGVSPSPFHSLECLLSGLVGETASEQLKGKPQ